MNALEALALRRAEEQIETFRWVEEPKPPRKLRMVTARSPGGRPPSCLCGECRKCRNRESMAEARALKRAQGVPVPRKRGRKLSDRLCVICREERIAVTNGTGICRLCHQHRAHKVGKVAVRGSHFSHGGGI